MYKLAIREMHLITPRPKFPPDNCAIMTDGARLPTNMRQRVANGTLFIDNVQRNADNGTYSCVAKNKHNLTSQRTVEVNVLGKFAIL